MAANPPHSTLHDGQSESDLEFERFEYLASPRMSVPRRASDTEIGLPKTDGMTVHTQDPQTDTETKRSGFDWSGSWAWEIGSVTLAVVGVVLLVAFLFKINNTHTRTGNIPCPLILSCQSSSLSPKPHCWSRCPRVSVS